MKRIFTLVSLTLMVASAAMAENSVFTSAQTGIVYTTNVTAGGDTEDAAEKSMHFQNGESFLGVAQNTAGWQLVDIQFVLSTYTSQWGALTVGYSNENPFTDATSVHNDGFVMSGMDYSIREDHKHQKFFGVKGDAFYTVDLQSLTVTWEKDSEQKSETLTYASFGSGTGSGTVGIENIDVDNTTGAAEWYTLTGARVADPQPGTLYIRVADGKAAKVIR